MQQPTKRRPFEEAREYTHSLKLGSAGDWRKHCTSGQKPDDIPSNPHLTYRAEWKGWGDWLGTENIATYNREYLPFEEAREAVHNLEFKSEKEWRKYLKSGQKPDDIPSSPHIVYKDKWEGWGDFLGTGRVRAKEWPPFEEAREYVRSLGLKSQTEWTAYCKSGQKPDDIPSSPEKVYKDQWKGMGDWLGVISKWTKPALLALLEDLRSHIDVLDEGEIYMLLQKSGALPALFLATRVRSVQNVLKDLEENDGKSIEAGIKGIAERELEAVQNEIDDSICEEEVNDGSEVSQIEAEKILGGLSKLVTSQSLRTVDEMRPPRL